MENVGFTNNFQDFCYQIHGNYWFQGRKHRAGGRVRAWVGGWVAGWMGWVYGSASVGGWVGLCGGYDSQVFLNTWRISAPNEEKL